MIKKVDFVIYALYGGGAERVMVIIADYLVKKNYDVSLITFNEGDTYEINSKIKRVRLHSGSNNIPNHTIRSIYNLFKYYKNKNNRPDVMIPFMTTTGLVCIIVSKFFKLKVIVSEHINHLSKLQGLRKFTKKYMYRYADLITVLTTYDVDFYKRNKANVIVMPNPCTFKPFDIEKTERNQVIIAVGSLNRYHQKGFDNLVTIVDPILKENPAWKLKIVGGGDVTLIKDLVIKAGIEQQVEFTGFTNEVSKLMQSSDIFILPSRQEGLPMVLLEAMSQGMACIAYDCKTGPSDIIENKVDGVLIRDQDIEHMQACLRELINNEDLRNGLRRNAIKITDKYSLELIGKKWETCIQKITA